MSRLLFPSMSTGFAVSFRRAKSKSSVLRKKWVSLMRYKRWIGHTSETRMQQDIDLAVEGLKLKDRTDLPDPKRNAKLLSKSNQKFLSKKEMGTPLEELVYPEDVDLYYRLVHDNGNEDMFHIQRQHRIEYQGPWTVMEDEIPETTQYSNLFAVTGQLTDLTDLPDPIEGKRVLAIDQAICDLTDDDHEKIMGFFD